MRRSFAAATLFVMWRNDELTLEDPLADLLATARALSDPGRVRILTALGGGELCGCHLIELLELAPSTVSKHLGVLSEAGLVVGRREGRWVHYRRSTRRVPAAVRGLVREALRGVAHSELLERDRARLGAIRGSDCGGRP